MASSTQSTLLYGGGGVSLDAAAPHTISHRGTTQHRIFAFWSWKCQNAQSMLHQKNPLQKFANKSWLLKNHISSLVTDLDPDFSQMSYDVMNFIFQEENTKSIDVGKNPLKG